MAHKTKLFDYKDDDLTKYLNARLLGVMKPGRYSGFEPYFQADLILRLRHVFDKSAFWDSETTPEYQNNLGVIMTPQGIMLREDRDDIDLTISAGDSTHPRIDIIVCTLPYVESVGGVAPEYSVIEGTPSSNPVAEVLPEPSKQIELGRIYIPANAANLQSPGVHYKISRTPVLQGTSLQNLEVGKAVVPIKQRANGDRYLTVPQNVSFITINEADETFEDYDSLEFELDKRERLIVVESLINAVINTNLGQFNRLDKSLIYVSGGGTPSLIASLSTKYVRTDRNAFFTFGAIAPAHSWNDDDEFGIISPTTISISPSNHLELFVDGAYNLESIYEPEGEVPVGTVMVMVANYTGVDELEDIFTINQNGNIKTPVGIPTSIAWGWPFVFRKETMSTWRLVDFHHGRLLTNIITDGVTASTPGVVIASSSCVMKMMNQGGVLDLDYHARIEITSSTATEVQLFLPNPFGAEWRYHSHSHVDVLVREEGETDFHWSALPNGIVRTGITGISLTYTAAAAASHKNYKFRINSPAKAG